MVERKKPTSAGVFYEYLNFIQLCFVIIALAGIYFARLEIKPTKEI